jgi:hypothetical protein
MAVPTILYKLATPEDGGSHRGPKGRYYHYLGVETAGELAEALLDGWQEDLLVAVGLTDAPEVQKPQERKPAPKKQQPQKKVARKRFGEEADELD